MKTCGAADCAGWALYAAMSLALAARQVWPCTRALFFAHSATGEGAARVRVLHGG